MFLDSQSTGLLTGVLPEFDPQTKPASILNQ